MVAAAAISLEISRILRNAVKQDASVKIHRCASGKTDVAFLRAGEAIESWDLHNKAVMEELIDAIELMAGVGDHKDELSVSIGEKWRVFKVMILAVEDGREAVLQLEA